MEIGKSSTLDHIKANSAVRIKEIEGGWGIRQRLLQLGINIGDVIQVKREGAFGGPILISSKNSNIAIGRGMAKKIIVEVVDNNINKRLK